MLHNICETIGDHCLEEWTQVDSQDDVTVLQGRHGCNTEAASTIRDQWRSQSFGDGRA